MKKTRILSLLLCLSIFCTLIVPSTRAYAESDPDNGMKISKTATANKDGSYTITLEAFATGSKTTTVQEKDIPTDIILVLDQSGSMADDIGQVQYTAYTGKGVRVYCGMASGSAVRNCRPPCQGTWPGHRLII